MKTLDEMTEAAAKEIAGCALKNFEAFPEIRREYRATARIALTAAGVPALLAEVDRLNARHVANIAARDAARRIADDAHTSRAEAEKRLGELQRRVRVPDNAVRADAWVCGGYLIVCGDPPAGNGDVDDPAQHNCDAMGCSSVSHVIIREKLDADGTLASRDALAERVRELEGAAMADRFFRQSTSLGDEEAELLGKMIGEENHRLSMEISVARTHQFSLASRLRLNQRWRVWRGLRWKLSALTVAPAAPPAIAPPAAGCNGSAGTGEG